jgi:hypothetical protein
MNEALLKKVSRGYDPIGTTYSYDNGRKYYRRVFTKSEAWLKMVCESHILEVLAQNLLIPPQSFLAERTQEFCGTLVSDGAPWNIHPSAYPLLAFRDAALVWIRINEILLEEDERWGLTDGHYENFAIFQNSRPKWVDIGSIGILKSKQHGIDQFVRYFIFPIIIFNEKPQLTHKLRSRLRQPKGGLTKTEFDAYFGIERDIGIRPTMSRGEALRHLRSLVENIFFEGNRGFWSDYRNATVLSDVIAGKYLKDTTDPRPRQVVDLVRSVNVSTIIDIGANDGLFSLLCARENKVVLSVDTDDAATNKLYRIVSDRQGIDICVSVNSFIDAHHSADLVLALALSHHLFLRQGIDWNTISARLALMATKAVITEFMPDGLGGTRTHPEIKPKPLPKNYTLDEFTKALKQHFKNVRVIDYGRIVKFSRRTLILCTLD